MEAAEKIPKKLYVYLDTTRGRGHRHGGEDVYRGRAGDRVRHRRQRSVRVDLMGGEVESFALPSAKPCHSEPVTDVTGVGIRNLLAANLC